MRKPLLLALTLLLVMGACSKSKEGNLTLGGTSASPGATAATGGTATSAPKTSAKAGGTKPAATTSSSGTKGGSQSTPKPAPAGGSNTPKDGSYGYTVSGTATNPQTGQPSNYSNQTVTAKISHKGDVYSTEQSSNQGTNTSKDQWTSTKVLFLSVSISSPYGTFSCTYKPPLTIAKFPTKPETFPQQQLSGSGNACGGTLDIQVLRKENVADATGHSWSSWVIHVKINSSFKYNGQTITTKSDEMRWVSPDLGVQVKSVADTESDTPFGKAKGHATSLLKSHP